VAEGVQSEEAPAEIENRMDEYSQRSLDPYEVSDALRPAIDALDLWIFGRALKNCGTVAIRS
jgi:hypothetical protein